LLRIASWLRLHLRVMVFLPLQSTHSAWPERVVLNLRRDFMRSLSLVIVRMHVGKK
jgi:hypothetical protein